MYIVACEIENGFQNNAYKATCDLTKDWAVVHEMIKLQEGTFRQPVKAMGDFIIPTGELLLKAIERDCHTLLHLSTTIAFQFLQSVRIQWCQREACNSPFLKGLKGGGGALNESVFEKRHGGP